MGARKCLKIACFWADDDKMPFFHDTIQFCRLFYQSLDSSYIISWYSLLSSIQKLLFWFLGRLSTEFVWTNMSKFGTTNDFAYSLGILPWPDRPSKRQTGVSWRLAGASQELARACKWLAGASKGLTLSSQRLDEASHRLGGPLTGWLGLGPLIGWLGLLIGWLGF